MKSPAPLFSKALFNKNLHRFWPLLAAYMFFAFIVSFAVINYYRYVIIITSEKFMSNLYSTSPIIAFVIGLFSIVLAVAIFAYMHNSVATAMLNSLPYKRKTVFFSNYISGLFMLLAPLLVLFLAFVGICLSFNCLDFIALSKWLFIFASLSVLLYSLAVTLGMLTGHIVAHIVFFAIANFIFISLEGVIKYFLTTFLYGFIDSSNFYIGLGNNWLTMKLTPLAYVGSISFAEVDTTLITWLVYLLFSVLLFWLGLKLYEKRKMENAGDIIAIRKLNHLFKYGVAFCSSLAFGMILIEIFNVGTNFALSVFLVLLMGLVGYFVAEMLLRKSYRVLDAYKGFIVYALILLVVSFSIYYDWYGYANRTPDINKVEAVAFSNDWLSSYTVNHLQAEQSRVFMNDIPNIPNSLALSYGNPIDRIEEPSGTYSYIYKKQENLSKEETELLWTAIPGIYTEDASIGDIYKLHTYLTNNIKEVRNNYRTRDTNKWYAKQERQYHYFNISIVYKLTDGQVDIYNYPVIIPKEALSGSDNDIYNQLVAIAGSAERRSKKANTLDIETANIVSILLNDNISTEKYDYYDKYSAEHPLATRETEEIKIAPEDYTDFLAAIKADYLSMDDEEMLQLNYNNWSYIRISIDNQSLPSNNKFREKSETIDIDFSHLNTLNFLYDNGYITEDLYNYVVKYPDIQAEEDKTSQSNLLKINVA
ncbi:MAG: ABC transporter permease [Syntrophomonadaceae bacterium]|nr:ABC transporter permease [Syntrophomonadaceae bacterium]